MEKEEFAVGEVFQCGLKKLKVVETTPFLRCMGCYFKELCIDKDVTDMVGECISRYRSDKQNVVFVELKEEEE